jgi:hypothetical protein
MIIFQHRIYRSDLQNNPSVYYVFGDNLQREGLGGQAAHMRGEPNAVGIATKRMPSCEEEAFFSDQPGEMSDVSVDLMHLKLHLTAGHTLIVPSDGLGTGLSELPTRSPKIHALIKDFFKNELGVVVPWK